MRLIFRKEFTKGFSKKLPQLQEHFCMSSTESVRAEVPPEVLPKSSSCSIPPPGVIFHKCSFERFFEKVPIGVHPALLLMHKYFKNSSSRFYNSWRMSVPLSVSPEVIF